MEMIDEAFMAGKTTEERSEIVLSLLQQVDAVLENVSPALKTLVVLEMAAGYAVANGASAEHFIEAAAQVYASTLDEVGLYAQLMVKEGAEIK